MGRRIKIISVKGVKAQYVKPKCNKCALREMKTCPYLEEIANCRLFKIFEGRTMATLSLSHASKYRLKCK